MASECKGGAISSLSLAGRVWGEVRRLPGFDKKRHRVPDQVNSATQGFLFKLSGEELEADAEALFQSARRSFGYKRQQLSLSVGSGLARLESTDFAIEIRYDLDEDDPSRYFVETEVVHAASRDLLESEPFNAAVGSRFDRLRCGLRAGVSVESIIDAVEGDLSGELSVEYPSDCSECTVQVEGVNAEIVVDGSRLEARYRRLATAGELVRAFENVGERFDAAVGLGDLLR